MFRCHRSSHLATALSLAVLLTAASLLGANMAWAQSQDVTVSVVDSKEVPLPGAEVEIFEEFYQLKATPFKGKTDAAGTVRFEGVALKGHAYLVVRHAEYAPAMHYLSITGQDNVKTTIRLAPATRTFVEIRSPDGQPLAGAEVTRLEFSSELTGAKHFANHDFFKAMMQNDGAAFQSDAAGRLHLPPLPSDAVLSMTVTHPKFAVGQIKEVKAADLANATIEVKQGTTVEAYLVGDPAVLQKLEGERLRLGTSNRERSSLYHSFQVQNGKFEFSLPPGRYDSLSLSGSPDLVITPVLPSSFRLAEFANIPEADRVQKKFVVRELHPVKGRVMTPDGVAVPNLDLSIEYENLYLDEAGRQQVVAEHPAAYDSVTTDREGRFECRLPKGPISIFPSWDCGYYSDPVKLEFVYEDQPELPDYVVKPMPVLKGIAVNEEGQPVPHAVLRLLDHTDSYVFADQNGRFEVPVSVLDFDDKSQSFSRFKTIAAFDLGSRLCCVESIEVTAEDSVADLKLKLQDHPVDWLLQRLREAQEKSRQRILAGSNYFSEEIEKANKRLEEMRAKYKFAPDLTEAIWLKGMGSRSLSDYRGSYVLLDFWFIGCGPCEREIPNLKLVHEKFKDRHFSVIGIHIAGQDSELVEKYMDERALEYPMLIDRFDEPIQKAYEPLGLRGYPTYFLITPTGEIDWDAVVRTQVLETVRDRILKLEASR
ncbi:MAG: redoxin domain-containing protein [Planctomycetota bacterium]